MYADDLIFIVIALSFEKSAIFLSSLNIQIMNKVTAKYSYLTADIIIHETSLK